MIYKTYRIVPLNNTLTLDAALLNNFSALPLDEQEKIRKCCDIMNALYEMALIPADQFNAFRQRYQYCDNNEFYALCKDHFKSIIDIQKKVDNKIKIDIDEALQVLFIDVDALSIEEIIDRWFHNNEFKVPEPLHARAWMLDKNEPTSLRSEIISLVSKLVSSNGFEVETILTNMQLAIQHRQFDNIQSNEIFKLFYAVIFEDINSVQDQASFPNLYPVFAHATLMLAAIFQAKELGNQCERLYLLMQRQLFLMGVLTSINQRNLTEHVQQLFGETSKKLSKKLGIIGDLKPYTQTRAPIDKSLWYGADDLVSLMEFFQQHETELDFQAYVSPMPGNILAAQAPLLQVGAQNFSELLFQETILESCKKQERFVIPINIVNGKLEEHPTDDNYLGAHWTALLVDPVKKEIIYIDPQGNGLNKDLTFMFDKQNYLGMLSEKRDVAQSLIKMVQSALIEIKDSSNYTVTITGIGQQSLLNTDDCGVWTVANAISWLKNEPFLKPTPSIVSQLRKLHSQALKNIKHLKESANLLQTVNPLRITKKLQELFIALDRKNITVGSPDLINTNFSLPQMLQLIAFFKNCLKPKGRDSYFRREQPYEGKVYEDANMTMPQIELFLKDNTRRVCLFPLVEYNGEQQATIIGNQYALLAIDPPKTAGKPIQIILVNPLGNTTSNDITIPFNDGYRARLLQSGVKESYINILEPLLESIAEHQAVSLSLSEEQTYELRLLHCPYQNTAQDSSVFIVHYAIEFLARGTINFEIEPALAILRDRFWTAHEYLMSFPDWLNLPIQTIEKKPTQDTAEQVKSLAELRPVICSAGYAVHGFYKQPSPVVSTVEPAVHVVNGPQ